MAKVFAPPSVRRLGYALGAEVRGVDLSRPVSDETIAELRRLWLEHLLLCFPDQDMSAAALTDFASRFGPEFDDNQHAKLVDPDYPYVMLLSNKASTRGDGRQYRYGGVWHSDRIHTDHPNTATILIAKMLPSVGGNTAFANQYLAYETLSPKMKAILESLSAVHEWPKYEPVVHPAVRTHPETNRKALILGDRATRFEGMTDEESRPLLDFLRDHAVRYEFVYRHRWQVGDLVMWDNRCMMHRALGDYDTSEKSRHVALLVARTALPERGAGGGVQESVRSDRQGRARHRCRFGNR